MVVLIMKTLILTHDINLYGKAILLTCSLGCSNIASHLHSRWFPQRDVNVVLIHWLVKTVIVLWGLLFIPIFTLFNASVLQQLISIAPALLLAKMGIKIEYVIQRWYMRRQASKSMPQKRYIYYKNTSNKTMGLAVSFQKNKVNLKNVHEHHARLDSQIKQYTLRDIILVAIGEEFIFRGFLWQLSLLWHEKIWVIISLLLTVILFGASHLTMGKGQFLSKTILGMFCLVSVIVFHSILPGIIIHVVFNICAYKEMQLGYI
jgi:hypothetical protein